MSKAKSRPCAERHVALLAVAVAFAIAAALSIAGGAPAHDLQSRLDQKRSQLEHAKSREGVLSTTIQRYGERLDQLRSQVATLRNREAIVEAQLERTKAELQEAKHRLAVLRVRLRRSLRVLRERLVEIYESSQPDALTVILNARGFDDLANRYEYLRRVESQDASIAQRVRKLRNETKDTV